MPTGENPNLPASYNLAKYSVPRSRAWVPRRRLFDRLDKALIHPLIWVGSPAGAGKTALLASYLQDTRTSLIWINLDENDADPASFFHHLRASAQSLVHSHKLPLPPLTPDYLHNIRTYARNFFREFFRAFPEGGIVVLDNVQDVTAQGDFLTLLNLATHETPEDVAIVCLSRYHAPAIFSRALLNGDMVEIGGDELKWTGEEIAAMAESMSLTTPSTDVLERLREQTDGWSVGLALLLRDNSLGPADRVHNGATEQTLFNYFASEIFRQLNETEKNLLLATAFLPEIEQRLAIALTDETHATDYFEQLVEKNYFTVKLTANPPTYRFHPLFREFLRYQARQSKSAKEIASIQTTAATLLADQQNYPAAITLMIDAQQWELLARTLCQVAPSFIAEGRHQSLLDRLNDVSATAITDNPWLLYWKAVALLPIDFDKSHALFADAYRLFEEYKDARGMALAWAGAVETVVHALSHVDRLDHWIVQLGRMEEQIDIEQDPVLQAYIAPQVVAILALRGNQMASLEKWLTIAQVLLTQPVDPTQRIMASFTLIVYFHWSGRPERAVPVLKQQQAILASEEVAPLPAIITKLCTAWFSWLTGRYRQCNEAIDEGMAIVKRTGVQHWTFILLVQGVTNALMQGKTAEAKRFFDRLTLIQPCVRDMDRAYFHNESAWMEMLSGRPELALSHQLSAVTFAESMAAPFVIAETYFGLSQIYHAVGNNKLAREYLDKCRIQSERYASQTLSFQCDLIDAYYLLTGNDEASAVQALAEAFAKARQKGYSGFAWWRPNVMARLCHLALVHDIEPGFVRNFIRQFDLPPPMDSCALLESWPWPVRIQTLGRFTVTVENEPISFDRKVQKRPLELLKLLIAYGGNDISEARIMDALWPDADADMAHQNLKSTMHRLRKLIPPEAVSVAEGKLSIDRRYCWVDLPTLDTLATEIDHISATTQGSYLGRLCQQLKSIYHGDFLTNEDESFWVITPREQYRALFLRSTEKLGAALLAAHRYEAARDCFEYGLGIDPLVERFYQGLMRSYWGLGLAAEVQAVFERCRTVLQAALGLDCAAETKYLTQHPPT